MSKLRHHRQILIDSMKRTAIDFARTYSRLRTPMDMLTSILNAYGYLPKEIIAVELFGMHGLWVTRDYASICSYLEFYELDPVYASYARKTIKNAIVLNSDSIEAVTNRQLKRSKYNYIVCDNPFTSPYGKEYYEHFALFPSIVDYIDSGVLAFCSFAYNIDGMNVSKDHYKKRQEFYGKANPSVKEAVEVYKKQLSRREVVDYIFLPRNENLSILVFVLK